MPQVTEIVKFRIFSMPCCRHQLCWVNPRLPTYCPECGSPVLLKLRFNGTEHTLFEDDDAQLRIRQRRPGDAGG